jgi:L-amino acid N-acyltransferase YncA
MKVRKAVLRDAKGVSKVQVDCWKTTYKDIVPDAYLNQMTYESREQKWKEIILNSNVFVAENDEGKIIGFSNGGIERTGNYQTYMGELYAIYILKEYQRNGIGRLLLQPIIDELTKQDIFSMIVLVLEANNSRMFYETLGAKKIDTVKIEILGQQLNEFVYGWDDIRKII